MNWGSWSECWAMGGYGFFVWGSYAVTIAAIVVEIALVRTRHRRALIAIERIEH